MFKRFIFIVVLVALLLAVPTTEAAEDGGLLLRIVPGGDAFSIIIGNRTSETFSGNVEISPGVILVGTCDGDKVCQYNMGSMSDGTYGYLHPTRVRGFSGMVTVTVSFHGSRHVTLTETINLEPIPLRVSILDSDENLIVLTADEDVMLAANGGQQLFVEGSLFKILNANCFVFDYPAGCVRLTSLTAPAGVTIDSRSPRWEVSGQTATRRNLIYLPIVIR